MRKRTKEAGNQGNETGLAKEALDVARMTIRAAREGQERDQKLISKTLAAGKEAVNLVNQAAAMNEELLGLLEERQPYPVEVLTPSELVEVAELHPRWAISTGFSHGKTSKSFTRNLGDLVPEKAKLRDTYLRFSDVEHSDRELAAIFDENYVEGDMGSFPHFRITSENSTPISRHDIDCIEKAEEYLLEQGLIVPKESVGQTAAN